MEENNSVFAMGIFRPHKAKCKIILLHPRKLLGPFKSFSYLHVNSHLHASSSHNGNHLQNNKNKANTQVGNFMKGQQRTLPMILTLVSV